MKDFFQCLELQWCCVCWMFCETDAFTHKKNPNSYYSRLLSNDSNTFFQFKFRYLNLIFKLFHSKLRFPNTLHTSFLGIEKSFTCVLWPLSVNTRFGDKSFCISHEYVETSGKIRIFWDAPHFFCSHTHNPFPLLTKAVQKTLGFFFLLCVLYWALGMRIFYKEYAMFFFSGILRKRYCKVFWQVWMIENLKECFEFLRLTLAEILFRNLFWNYLC